MKKTFVWAILVSGLLAASCAGSKVDGLLNELDKLVDDLTEYSQEALQLSTSSDETDPVKVMARLTMVQKEMEKFQKKVEVVTGKLSKYEDNLTAEQTERYMRIIFRMGSILE